MQIGASSALVFVRPLASGRRRSSPPHSLAPHHHAHRQARRRRRRHHGERHRRPRRVGRHPGRPPRHPRTGRRPERPRARRASSAPARRDPPRSWTSPARGLISIGNLDDSLELLARLRPDPRGDHRAARPEAGALRAARAAAQATRDRRLQHVGHPDAHPHRGTQRPVQAALPRHALLQSAALSAPARAHPHRRHAPEALDAARRFSEIVLGKGIVAREGRPGIRRQPARRVRDGRWR